MAQNYTPLDLNKLQKKERSSLNLILFAIATLTAVVLGISLGFLVKKQYRSTSSNPKTNIQPTITFSPPPTATFTPEFTPTASPTAVLQKEAPTSTPEAQPTNQATESAEPTSQL